MFVKADIDALESSLQEAEAKEPSEQESAFMVACKEAENKHDKITLFLDIMIYLSRMIFRIFYWFLFPLAAFSSLTLCSHSVSLGTPCQRQ